MTLHVYLLKLPEPDAAFLSRIISQLPPPLQHKISRLKRLPDQWCALFSDLLLRTLLSHELQIAPDTVKIEIGSHGKPFLKGKKREFNLSHSNAYIACATDDSPVGIDIEQIKPLDDLENLVENCFSEKEKQAFRATSHEHKLALFYEIWTLKESYLKALGEGISLPLHSVCTLSRASWHFKRYGSIEHYSLAVCATHSRFPEHPQMITPSDLLERL